MKGIHDIIKGYCNVVNPISSIQRKQDIDNNMLYNNNVTDNTSLNK